MSRLSLEKTPHVSYVWMALRRFDKNDDRVVALRELPISSLAEASVIIKIIITAFGLNCHDVVLKIRNHRGCLIPLNNLMPANTKHIPYVLEVAKVFQHVCPRPRTIPTTVLNRSMKTRLQTINRRIQRLEELLPQIKLRRHEKLTEEIECLSQKLRFLHKRMQVADSHSWKGVLTRAPLW